MGFVFTAVASVLLVGAEPAISTAAGTGRAGDRGDGGPAQQALLNGPFDVAFDRAGNMYFSDTGNHRVRKVETKSGRITTVAGNGKKGFSGDGGPAVDAQLDEPYGIVLDESNHLYIVDRLNRRIRKVDGKTGIITTVAGDGSKSYTGDGGLAHRAGLVEPNGIALDPDGIRLFIADVAGHRVRVVDLRSGRIGTYAGNGRGRHAGDGGQAQTAGIYGARAVEVGADGTVYIVEREGNSVRAVDPKTGVITTRAGTGEKGYSGDGEPASNATFNGPKEIAVDAAGNLWIVDTENHAIRRIDAKTGEIRTVAGTGRRGGDGDGGPATSARLDRPHGVAVGPDGAIYIGDTGNNRIRRVEP